MEQIIKLENYRIIEISGNDSDVFLQRLITNDIYLLEKQEAIFSVLLTPQGKFKFDFFITKSKNSFYIEISKKFIKDFLQCLELYKLLSDVQIRIKEHLSVYYSLSLDDNFSLDHTFCCYRDPRKLNLGYRVVIEEAKVNDLIKCDKIEIIDYKFYEIFRIRNVVPEGEYDLLFDKSFILEYGYNDLNAISFEKGCYVGQELTMRSFRRGVIRKKIISFQLPYSKRLIDCSELVINSKNFGRITSFVSDGDNLFVLLYIRKDDEVELLQHLKDV